MSSLSGPFRTPEEEACAICFKSPSVVVFVGSAAFPVNSDLLLCRQEAGLLLITTTTRTTSITTFTATAIAIAIAIAITIAMSHHRRPHYDLTHETAAGRLPYDDERDTPHEGDRAHNYDPDHEPGRWRGRRDKSYSPRGRDHSYYDDYSSRHDSRDSRTGDIRRSSPHRRLERSRSPYYPPDDSRPRHSHSHSPSSEARYPRRSPPPHRDYDRHGHHQYYDRDAPELHEPERAPYYGQPSRDVMLEGIGGDWTDHDVATLLPFAV
ncbi:hypothetical protein DRE_07194 [Drechslerella stenobrocha 248]|uniref:Uncharacterized protein n=1 Tax=Drechslerella stenobrocha 248 TaxID=1043628 RepID=W7HVQ7_9PEZI|nr:hypothetical protein DRE_07194 [Drechslerella stenobrocha 248]